MSHYANICMCFLESLWLSDSPFSFRPLKRYIDDTFFLFKHKEHEFSFQYYLNNKHPIQYKNSLIKQTIGYPSWTVQCTGGMCNRFEGSVYLLGNRHLVAHSARVSFLWLLHAPLEPSFSGSLSQGELLMVTALLDLN